MTPDYRGDEHETTDGAQRLRVIARAAFASGRLVVVANRAPYTHQWRPDGSVAVERPASGLVTGVEPLLRACGGTWVAYGGGAADRAISDGKGRVRVPPEKPEYTLRHVWVGEDEYERYYSGFANEALWPLCHLAYTQPLFRRTDWESYEAVNLAFARAALEESGPDGVILIQDYHFALLPRLIRERAPRAASSIFWHIPWPHPDVIAILPWKERVLDGMLGADIIGFHTRDYCLRFMESAQRHAGAIVNFEAMTVRHRGRETKIRAYPISVEWPYRAATRERGAELRRSLGIAEAVHVGLGVDRADYTKGLLERIAAVEVLLERNPALTGRYSLVQLASPTRTRIPKYQRLLAEVADAAERVNGRFRNESWQPVVLQTRTFSQDEVREYYAMADSALVTPLHDGMNLVAKEYVAACEDGRGVLILSRFAGAAQELESALLVNPYDAEEIADALLQAMVMPSSERRARMETMRARIAAHSIYDWSEQIITDVRSVRRTAVYGPPRIAGVDQRLAVRP